eukprot:5205-Pyramimonas_sp.AAC.1
MAQDGAAIARVARLIAGDTGARLAGPLGRLGLGGRRRRLPRPRRAGHRGGAREWLARRRQGLFPGRPPPATEDNGSASAPPPQERRRPRRADGSRPR